MKSELLDEINDTLVRTSRIVSQFRTSLYLEPNPYGDHATLTPKFRPENWEELTKENIVAEKAHAYRKIEDIVKDPSFSDQKREIILDRTGKILTQTGHESIYNQVNQFIQEQPYRSIIFKDFNAAATEKIFEGKHAEQAAEIKKQPDRTDGLKEVFDRNTHHQRSNSHDRDQSQGRDER